MVMTAKFVVAFVFVFLLVVVFQNCSPSFSSAPNETERGALASACSNSSLAGSWSSNPLSPNDPSAEILTLSNDCRATSKLCGGSISFSQIPEYVGSPIQGTTTLSVAGSNQSATCLPDGTYDCTYGIGPSSQGDLLSARCGPYDLVYYRTAAEPAAVAPKLIYFTTQSYGGYFASGTKFTNTALADLYCNTAPPVSGKTFKALIATSARRACTTANCSGSGEGLDWALQPSTTYVRTDGSTVGVTNDKAIFTFNLQNPIFDGGTLYRKYALTGLRPDWTSAAENCSDWKSSTGNVSIGALHSRTSSSIGVAASTPNAYGPCNANFFFICAEQ